LKKEKSTLKFLAEVLTEGLTLGIAVAGSIMAGAITGWLIDEKVFHGKYSPWITTIFLFFGVLGGIKNLIWYSKRKIKEVEKKGYDEE